MKKLFLFGTLALAGFLTACDKDEDEDVNATDQQFVMSAGMANRAEINAGQLAATRGSNAAVRTYGQMMVTEHTQAQNDLRSVSNDEGITMSDTVDATHQALMARLMTLNGYQFDTAYMNSQIRDHQNTIQLFQSVMNSGENDRVRTYANTYLPKIQMHYATADSIRQRL